MVASLVSVPAGQLADRFDRRRLLVLCNLARVVLLGALGLLIVADRANLLTIMSVALVSAVFLSISQPAGLAAQHRPPQLRTRHLGEDVVRRPRHAGPTQA